MAMKTWVLVANSGQARLFHLEKVGSLQEIKTFINPEARMLEQELNSTPPTRVQSRVGNMHSAVSPATSQKKHVIALFAKTIAEHLENERSHGKFDRIYLVASPSFLGQLRSALNPNTQQIVAGTEDKDIVHLEPHGICEAVMFNF